MTIPTDSFTQETLRALIATRLDIPPAEILGDINLVMLGMNSLEIMTIVNRLRRNNIPITYDAFAAKPTLNSWWQTVTTATNSQPNHATQN